MRIALAGNPNSGKTTLFNDLTGSTAHVGNWPGVTVERKEGVYKTKDTIVKIIDLPGIYSLSPYTPEEIVSRNYLVEETPDVIINVIDATNLERNLYLTTQILEMDCQVVVALNMMDSVEKLEMKIDPAYLEKKLGVPVVPISALRSHGVKELMERVVQVAGQKRSGQSVLQDSYLGSVVEQTISEIKQANEPHPVFAASKLLEGDELAIGASKLASKVAEIKESIPCHELLGNDFEAIIADLRYQFITKDINKVITQKQNDSLKSSDKADRILTHKWFGLPIFFAFMFGVFHFTFSGDFLFLSKLGLDPVESPGVFLQTKLGEFSAFIIDKISAGLESLGVAEWVHGLLVDGVLAGLDAVLSFLPQILMLFLFLSIMEDSGYMARAAFLMDRVLRRFGLSGKAFMPLLMGFGCSVPAMMATRTLESEKERRLTIMLMPFFSCGAKLPVWAMFSAAIFPDNADFVVFAIYMLGIATAIIAAIILKKFFFKGEVTPFILELPAYHLPRIKNLILHLWDKLKGFLIRASTIIAGATVVIWVLANFSFGFEMVEANSADSMIGVMGDFLKPIFIPLGFASGEDGWKAVVAALTGLLAKEMVVSTMGILYNPGIDGDALEDDGAADALIVTIAAAFSPLAAVSYMAFNLLSVPCMAAVATANSELRSRKWTWITIAFWLGTAWVVAFLIYQIGSLLGIGV